jgi:hypothetical protein
MRKAESVRAAFDSRLLPTLDSMGLVFALHGQVHFPSIFHSQVTMKKSNVLLSGILLAASFGAIGQANQENDEILKAQIIALDKQGWKAWKDNDPEWFQKNVTDGFLSISSDGVSNKAQVVEATPTSCKVKSYALDNFKFVRLDANTVLLSYSAKQDAVCDGKPAPAAIQVAVNYVRRGDRWLEAMYMQSP